MENVIVSYNNDPSTHLHDFFESCADDIKQKCVDCGHKYTSVCPPYLNHKNVIEAMEDNTICFVAAHGTDDAILNETEEEILSNHTTNYVLDGKVFYSVSCLCGISLGPELKRIGVSLFVGYKDNFKVGTNEELFKLAAISGLKSILDGDNFEEAKKKMYDCFDACIDSADFWDGAFLLHDRDCLMFE